MVHRAPALPHGHGEVLTSPPYERWAELMEANKEAVLDWRFDLADMPAAEMRRLAREETLTAASAFSARLGVDVAHPLSPSHLVLTGHQPEIYHPGVWIKVFLLQRLADETGAAAIDLVVDSDTFDTVGIKAPCLLPDVVQRSTTDLVVGGGDRCFACAQPPSTDEIESFCAEGAEALKRLPTWAVLRHFTEYCDAMRSAHTDADNLAEFMTFARRRYENIAATDYLELPVTAQSGTSSFRRFFAHIALDAERFAEDYNTELAAFRAETKSRSAAQPFPDLSTEDGLLELPFWYVEGRRRTRVRVRTGAEVEVHAGGEVIARLRRGEDVVEALAAVPGVLAPKAAALTMFARMFVADLFVHGVGGARYDRVTDGVIRRFFGVEPPRYCVASMTMYLPLGGFIATEDDLAAADQRLHRLEHNPDQMLHEVEFESSDEHARATALAEEKADLVTRIGQPAADKKTLGSRIREVNAELARLLAPLADELREERERLVSLLQATEVVTDRTYPFCFWSPLEIQDQAR